MKWIEAVIVCMGFIIVTPCLASAQTTGANDGSGLSLQGSAGMLQQPGSGFQGTSPQNLTAPSASGLNQNTHSSNTSIISIKPSETSTTITPIDNKKGFNLLQIIVLLLILIGAGLVLWRQGTKL